MKENSFIIPQLQKRNRKAKMFHRIAAGALYLSLGFLAFFLGDMLIKGIPTFTQSYMKVEVHINQDVVDNPYAAVDGKTLRIISRAWLRDLPRYIENNPELMGKTLSIWAMTDDSVDQYLKGHHSKLNATQRELVDMMKANGEIEERFNTHFFSHGDSKIPEYAGFWSAIVGSLLTMLVTMVISVPIGVMTAIYLEEFAPDNKLTQIIEVNINNLAAIPSILFGLLGLAIFINFFGVPRSSPLVGGMTLALMALPIIIVSAKAALKAVPDTIRQAGIGLGLTKWQVVRDHVLPLAFPGILTGSIISLAQAIGETAPLIIVGMIAFVPDAPNSIMEAATVMPAQVFTWAGMPERAYIEKTAAGILVLLGVMISLNGIAIYLRKRFQVKW
ncbi:MAG: phosphate ABC transporter permease PstA [Campylobacterales bacterium]